jgi:hypothetical protein
MQFRTTWQNLFAAAALLLAGSVAQAGTLPFTASLSVEIVQLPAIVLSGAGVATANGSGGGSHLASLQLAGSTFATTGLVLPITDPAAYPNMGVHVTAHNGAGTFVDGRTATSVSSTKCSDWSISPMRRIRTVSATRNSPSSTSLTPIPM